MAKLTYYVSVGKLFIKDKKKSYWIDATSGKDNCMNQQRCQKIKNEGPIPLGEYFIYRKEISDPDTVHDVIRNFEGDWRVSLHEGNGTETFGRSGFFIHGGTNPGSAGCIDIGGSLYGNKLTDKVLNSLKQTEISTLKVMP